MKLAGFLLLPAGWIIAVAAPLMLPSEALRAAFIVAGLAIEAVGIALAGRQHRAEAGDFR